MFEIITTSILTLSVINGGIMSVSNISSTSTVNSDKDTAKVEEVKIEIPTNEGIKKKVNKYFSDTPVLAAIAMCESSMRQYDQYGNVLRGKVNKGDMGVMQINEYYHSDKAESLGYDLETIEGNLAYAKYLYDKEGVQPWMSSSNCWKVDFIKDQVAIR